MTDDNKATLEKANAAALIGDVEGFLALCTEDTEWTFVGDQVLRGKAAVREWMKEAYRAPPKFDVQRMVAEGDLLTAIGAIVVIKADGTEVESSYCDVWRFRDGLLARLHAFVVEGRIEQGAFD